jgi:hypothetical protein
VAVWHPEQQQWVFAELIGLAFGLAVAVLMFRVPAHLVALARRWLGIPCLNYFDDFRFHCLQPHAQATWTAFTELAKLTGWIFDPDKDQEFSSSGTFLGVLEDVSLAHMGRCTLAPKPSFLLAIVETLQNTLEANSYDSGHGKLPAR